MLQRMPDLERELSLKPGLNPQCPFQLPANVTVPSQRPLPTVPYQIVGILSGVSPVSCPAYSVQSPGVQVVQTWILPRWIGSRKARDIGLLLREVQRDLSQQSLHNFVTF